MHDSYLFYLTAMMMGVLGSAHCIGMCGGIVCTLCQACPGSRFSYSSFFSQLGFNMGRVLTYTLLGALTGLIGLSISRLLGSGGIYYLRYFSVVLMVLVGLHLTGWFSGISIIERAGQGLWSFIRGFLKYFLPVTTIHRAIALGGIWGFLPCGLVYSALLYAASSGEWVDSALAMFFFGVGTMPAMLLFGTAMQRYAFLIKSPRVRLVSGVIILIFAGVSLLFIISHQSAHGCAHCHG